MTQGSLRQVTLINDCCLAFSVLVHNDGQGGSDNLRLLDLSEGPSVILDLSQPRLRSLLPLADLAIPSMLQVWHGHT